MTQHWVDWHRGYDEPGSELARRLEIVRGEIRRALVALTGSGPNGNGANGSGTNGSGTNGSGTNGRGFHGSGPNGHSGHPNGSGHPKGNGAVPVRVISMCAGQGRDLVGALDGHPARGRISGRLVEWEPDNVAIAGAALRGAGLTGLEVVRADAGDTSSYHGVAPADLVLACGVFGNITDDDIRQTIAALPSLCRAGGLVIWTRSRHDDVQVPMIRRTFAECGFSEETFVAPPDALLGVGVHRLTGASVPFRPGRKLFTFVH